MKVNTDGAYSATRYIAGGGGVIRDADGRLIFTFSDSFAALSSLEAEFKAFEQGIIAAVRFGNNIWMETDATSIVRIITSEEQVPAEIRHSIRRIKHLCKGLNIMVSYIAREGNKPADFLAERGLEEQGRSNFDHITAPARLKVMEIGDATGTQYLGLSLEYTATLGLCVQTLRFCAMNGLRVRLTLRQEGV
ncbi:hypothetical protein SASPL_129833 [Salvia splendens]|uniref:RNase H type-1 domain-containing protein n=1 Tax=Salvia splendens TaxID=180675 RepID=A0A8X8ZPT7_SALSN|nr:hypothetical protein SASPL_129833 [Salvia splendens]